MLEKCYGIYFVGEERGSSFFSVCPYFYHHFILFLEIDNSKLTTAGRYFFGGFLFLYPSHRVAEYLLVNIGGEMHCSKTMQKEKYILKQELELKEN